MPGPFYTDQPGPMAIRWLNDLFFPVGTSTTDVALQYGEAEWMTQTGLSLAPDQPVTLYSGFQRFAYGHVQSYNGATGALVVDVVFVLGSGSSSNWHINVAGQPGPPGQANTLTIGSVTSGPVAATITGAAPNQVLHLVLPPGEDGADGDVTPELEALRDETVDAAAYAAAAAGTATTQAGIATAQAGNAAASAGTATTQAGVATTQAGNAATSAGTATAQAGIATTQAGNAATSANTATAQAGIATTQAGNAATSAGAAATAETAAETAQGLAEGARDDAQTYAAAARRVALYFTYDNATADADPGAGKFRLNNAAVASATQVYIDLATANGGDVTAWIDSFDDSTNTTVKGELTFVDATDASVWFKLNVTAWTTATGYRKLTVAYVASNGALVSGRAFSLQFDRAGDKGADGLGTVAAVTASAPLASTGGSNPNITISPATTSDHGSMSAADKTKLDGVASGATANDTDAALRARSGHTGQQTASTISDFTAAAKAAAVANALTDGVTDVAPSQAAVKAYIDALLEAQDVLRFKGGVDCSANPNYPAANIGWFYKISVAGKIGGASGVNVESGDTMYCIVDGSAAGNQATVGTNWVVVQANLDGAVIGPGAVTDGNLAAFDGTTGKLIKQLTAAQVRTLLSLVVGSNVQAWDADLDAIAALAASNGDLIQRVSGVWANRTVTQFAADLQGNGLVWTNMGYRGVPQNSNSADYTVVAGDSGKHILHPSADTTARVFTIPANASVAFPTGTTLTFVNQNGAGVITIAITSDTMRLAGAGTTGNRTLAANGVATAIKVTATEWLISGVGLT